MWFKVYQRGLKTPVFGFFCFFCPSSVETPLARSGQDILWLRRLLVQLKWFKTLLVQNFFGVPKSLESLDGVLLVLLVSVSFFGGLGADFSSYSKSCPYSDC